MCPIFALQFVVCCRVAGLPALKRNCVFVLTLLIAMIFFLFVHAQGHTDRHHSSRASQCRLMHSESESAVLELAKGACLETRKISEAVLDIHCSSLLPIHCYSPWTDLSISTTLSPSSSSGDPWRSHWFAFCFLFATKMGLSTELFILYHFVIFVVVMICPIVTQHGLEPNSGASQSQSNLASVSRLQAWIWHRMVQTI